MCACAKGDHDLDVIAPEFIQHLARWVNLDRAGLSVFDVFPFFLDYRVCLGNVPGNRGRELQQCSVECGNLNVRGV